MKTLSLLFMLISFSAIAHVMSDDENTSDNLQDKIEVENHGKALTEEMDKGNLTTIIHRFIPLTKLNQGESVGQSYLDRMSIKLHSYNPKIRMIDEYINYSPALVQENHETGKKYYSSIKIEYFLNCDKMELAKGKAEMYQAEYGQGELIESVNLLNRWISPKHDSHEHKILLISCSLPI